MLRKLGRRSEERDEATSPTHHHQPSRAQRSSVEKLGGFPCKSRPTRNTLAANHNAAQTEATPIAIDSPTCQAGGGEADATLMSIANELSGGRKLKLTLRGEAGSRLIGAASS